MRWLLARFRQWRFERVLTALKVWCDHDRDNGCALRNTRYDNCRCEQQARQVIGR